MVHSYVLENSGHQVDLYGPKILIHTHELVFIFLLESKQTHSVSLPTNTELVGHVTVEHPQKIIWKLHLLWKLPFLMEIVKITKR